MALRIRINQKIDDKLIENFPNDPYADITIQLQFSVLKLSLAYLSIDSQLFAELSADVTTFDLSQFDQDCVIAVLRALYGGALQCTSVGDLQRLWPIIEYLKIEQYRQHIERELREWMQRREGGLGVLEWVDVCLRLGLLKVWIVEWLGEQRLKPLESTKNYLQLSKLTDQSLNHILLEYLKRAGDNPLVVNVILQNYFNRKGHVPGEYLQRPELAPLKAVWQKYHYRLKPKLEKTTSIQNLIATAVNSSPNIERDQPRNAVKLTKLGTSIGNFNCVSVDLAGELFKPEKMSEGYLLDMRINVLSNELEQKARRIQMLREELRELEEQRARKAAEEQAANEESMVDIALLKSRMRSRKEKQAQQQSASEYALDYACKRVGEQEPKMKLVSRNSMQRK